MAVDILRGGEAHNLLLRDTVKEWIAWIRLHRPSAGFLAPPCGTFSAWRHFFPWGSRTKENPWGDRAHWKEVHGNTCVENSLDIGRAFDKVRTMWGWENPLTSAMWDITDIWSLLRAGAYSVAEFHWCEWGHPWRKPTRVIGRCRALSSLNRKCSRTHTHVVLEGQVKGPDGKWISRTALAAEYSAEWCDAYAQLVEESLELPAGSSS